MPITKNKKGYWDVFGTYNNQKYYLGTWLNKSDANKIMDQWVANNYIPQKKKKTQKSMTVPQYYKNMYAKNIYPSHCEHCGIKTLLNNQSQS